MALMSSFPYLEPAHCSMSSSNCCFLTSIQISQEADQVDISFRIFQFVVIHTVKGFGIVNEAKKDVFLEFSCFFYNPTDGGNLISGSAAPSKSVLNIWKFLVHFFLYILFYFIYLLFILLATNFFFFTIFFSPLVPFFFNFFFFLICNIVLVFPYTHIVEA